MLNYGIDKQIYIDIETLDKCILLWFYIFSKFYEVQSTFYSDPAVPRLKIHKTI